MAKAGAADMKTVNGLIWKNATLRISLIRTSGKTGGAGTRIYL